MDASVPDSSAALADALRAGRPGFSGVLAGLREHVLASVVHGRRAVVGRYRLGTPLGKGAHGTVYEAFDPRLDRAVALKIVHVRTPSDCDRVVREARMLATVSDPHVVQVFEVGVVDDERPAPYVVMELVHGVTLREWQLAPGRSWRSVVEMSLQAARGLWAAHRVGIVHRDFKPDNAILGADGRLRVADFGLARSMQEAELTDEAQGSESGSGDPSLTPAGYVLGTPAYMAPEVFYGETGPASDQYALSVTLYEGLFGRRPFSAGSTIDLRAKVVRRSARLPRDRRGVPRRVCAVVMKGLARRAEDRHADLGAWIDALERAAAPRRVPVLVPVLGAGIVAVGLVAAGPAAAPCTTGEAAWSRARGEARLTGEVDAALAHHREAFVDTEQAACRGADGPLAWRTRSCLDARLRDVTALVAVVGDKASAVQALPSPRICGEPDTDRVAAPDPADAPAVEALERRLSELRALDATSSADKHALSLSARLLEDARVVDYAPVLAEAARMHGRMAMLNHKADEAQASFEDAYFVAQRADLWNHAARAATEVFRMHAYLRHDAAGAMEWRAHADAAFARAGIDARGYSPYLDATAWLAELQGDHALAAEVLREALEALSARGQGRSQVAGDVENHLGAVLAGSGDCEAALAPLAAAASIAEEIEGEASGRRAAALDNMGMCLTQLHRADEALPLHEEARTIRERIDPEQVDLGASYGNLGLVYAELGRLDEALAAMDRALAFFQAHAGESDPSVAMTFRFRAQIHERRGEAGRADARSDLASALRSYEALGPRYEATVTELRAEIAALDSEVAP
jgi:tetratricopeptide (TPR) repeat protein